MIWFALASALAVQTSYGQLDATPETYQAPAVRPFEPPSDFGREVAQGDADEALHRRALTAPVVVSAYSRSYETSPSDTEVAYDQGVTQAEINMDRRMGPLDGRWHVTDAQGRALLSLVLTDRGEGRRIEGAFRRLDVHAAIDSSGVAGPAAVQAETVVVPVGGGEMRLSPSGDGWTGVLVQGRESRPVTLSRAG